MVGRWGVFPPFWRYQVSSMRRCGQYLALISALVVTSAALADMGASFYLQSPYRAMPVLVLETDEQLAAAISALTTFPATLNPRLWNADGTFREDVRARTLALVRSMFDRLAFPVETVRITDIDLLGSNISREWDEKGDLDVHVFLAAPASVAPADFERLLSFYNRLTKLEQQGQITFNGVAVEVLFRGSRRPSEADEGGVPHFALWSQGPARVNRWFSMPKTIEDRFDRTDMQVKTKEVVETYNALMLTYFADKPAFRCANFSDLLAQLRTYRSGEIVAAGQRSTGNLVYRLLHRLNVDVQEETDAAYRECTNIQWSLR
ncbi:hypothetical protein [Ancylobacter amanitiformis]|uniref:Nucleotidyltransferase n=1 Tax=Ancylobacter amanitiformis TaxID=217069 RepID=A0ABU0LXE6_9HYPH|nr:hypothetical protein [Ancylobacter amanitiformis]MDQ0513402.1 hypothetical protein [Ancylobacter amanitiformis]